MTRDEILDELFEFTEAENNSKETYFNKKDEWKNYTPDNPNEFDDNYWFELKKRDSIYVVKHARYTAPFVHSHEFFEGVFAVSGSGICTFEEGNRESITLNKNDFIIIPPNVKHSLSVFSDNGIFLNLIIRKKTFRVSFFDFIGSSNVLNEFFVNYLLGNSDDGYLLFRTHEAPEIADFIIDMYKECSYPDSYTDLLLNQLVKTFFIHLLRLSADHVNRPDLSEEKKIFRTELIKYISENFRQITLDDVSKHFHFSSAYTSRMIRSKTGTTFNKLLKDIRMEHAKKLLVTTNMKISEISEAIGYLNIDHFIKTFKNEFNMTPSQYRNISKEKNNGNFS